MTCTKTSKNVRVVRELKVTITTHFFIYQEHLARLIFEALFWYLFHLYQDRKVIRHVYMRVGGICFASFYDFSI